MSDTLQSVGIREFRSNLHKYTTQNNDPIAVTSNGIRLGFYIPARLSPQEEDFIALKNAAVKMEKILADAGISEDEIVKEFDETRKKNRHYPEPQV